MAQFYLFSSTQKLSLLSKYLFRRSKRLLRSSATPIPLQKTENNIPCTLAAAAGNCNALNGRPIQDPNFYLRDSESAFLVFLVEKTLFKVNGPTHYLEECHRSLTDLQVHRSLLLRERSAFTDMISLPNLYLEEGTNDTSPIVLSDTVEQFRDLLWILYALYDHYLLFIAQQN